MNLTDNALRKLQQEGLFALGPNQQPPPDTAKTTPLEEAISPVELETQQETPKVAPSTSAGDPATAREPIESVRLAPIAPAEPQETESSEPIESIAPAPVDEPSLHERSAYDPVIPSFEGPPLSDDEEPSSTKPEPENLEATRDESVGIPEQPEEMMDVAEWLEDRESIDGASDRDFLTEESELLESITPSATADSLKEGTDAGFEEFEKPSTDHAKLEIRPEPDVPYSDEAAIDAAANTRSLVTAKTEEPAAGSSQTQNAEPHGKTPEGSSQAGGVTYEQEILKKLIDSNYAQPFLLFRDEILRRSGNDLPSSLLAASPETTSRSAEILCHLALIWDQPQEEILLVDANLEEQTLTRVFQAVGQPGLCDILTQDSCAADLIRCTRQPQLHFLPCGDDRTGLSRVPGKLDRDDLQEVLENLCRQYDRVFIDVGATSAALIAPLAELCDAAILVVSLQSTALPQLQSSADALRRFSRRVLGCVVTDRPVAGRAS